MKMKLFKITAIWVVTLAVCLFFVKTTEIGPIILSISIEYAVGVHSGDLIILFPLAAAIFSTIVIARQKTPVTL